MTEERKDSSPLDDYRLIVNAMKILNDQWEAVDFGMPGHRPKDLAIKFSALFEGVGLALDGHDLDSPPPDWKRLFNVRPVPATDLLPLIHKEIPYVIKPLLVRGSLTQLQGVPKGGKSAFSVYLSLCAASGIWPNPQYLNSEKPLNVVYITWEDPELMMAKRLSLYAKGIGQAETFLPTGLTFLFGPDIFVERGDHMAALRACIQDLRPDFIVVDTLSHIHLCEENASSEMKIPMKNLARVAKEEDVAIMYLHHTAKGSGDKLTQDKGRGSGAIAAAWHVLIDWGVREKGSNVNPVEIQSKYEHKWKNWDISYDAKEDEFGNTEAIAWGFSDQVAVGKNDPTSGDVRRTRILDVFRKSMPTKEWLTSAEICNLCALGIDERSMRRHLQKLCTTGHITSRCDGPNTPMNYKLAISNGNLSGVDF